MLRLTLVALVLLASSAMLSGAEAPVQATEQTGPIGPGTPPCRWGATAKNEVHDEVVWFGGVGGVSKSGALGTWLWKDGQWKRHESGDEAAKALHAKATALAADVRRLYVAVANRYYRSESEAAAKQRLDALCVELIGRLGKMSEDLAKADTDATLRTLRKKVSAFRDVIGVNQLILDSTSHRLASDPTVNEIVDSRGVYMAMVQNAWVLGVEPPPRAGHAMVYDADTRRIVMFGGEGEFGAYCDTWFYDCIDRKWEHCETSPCPSPRTGHGMVARRGKVYVVGGFAPRGSMSYCAALWNRLPFDVWELDIRERKWTVLKAGEGEPKPTHAQPPVRLAISEDGTELSWAADVISYGKKTGEITGSFKLADAEADLAEGEHGVKAGTIAVRGEGFDPAWYEKVPPADPKAVAAKLAALPPNRWVNMAPPKLHVMRDWGTTVLDTDRDELLHWGGGHSSHCGTDVAHYSIATNRWHIFYPPELPFEYCYSNDGAPVPSLTGRPWAPHTYLSYAYDPLSKLMIWTGRHSAYRMTNPGGTFLYDPERREWTAAEFKMEGGTFDPERHKTCMVPTPRGVAVWADKHHGTGLRSGLWLANVQKRIYEPVAGTDPQDGKTFPPPAFGDRHGITYDSKRDRVLIFHFGLKEKHKVWACDLGTKHVSVLEPKGAEAFPAEVSMGREATYIPDDDLVIVCTPAKPNQETLIYDCEANEWLRMPSPCAKTDKGGDDPAYGVSTGIEWDPKRKLLWLVQTTGAVYAMKFDRKTAGLEPLK